MTEDGQRRQAGGTLRDGTQLWEPGVVRDLEALTLRVWNPDVRPFIDEALRCHGAGAQRAAVVTT